MISRQSLGAWRFPGWYIPATLLMLLVIGCSLWAIPRRVHQVVLVDGTQQWTQQSAPPQRKITWRQAEPLTPSVIDAAIPESLVRPQFAEGGLALYYTLRQPGGEADIYRSQFDGKQWLAGEPVENLNLPAGDYGPVISTDGSTLYLYSDRPGGYGGYDLFVSRRTPAGWSEPENMGPLFNSPAHEYDPAISPDGKRLFFASNRTTTMENRLAIAADQGATVVPWRATLRAEVALQQFDLYVSELDGARAEWTAAVNFQAVNTLTANEGEPFVSPDGAFLYFTSDRTNPHGAARNYDIYRVRLRQAAASTPRQTSTIRLFRPKASALSLAATGLAIPSTRQISTPFTPAKLRRPSPKQHGAPPMRHRWRATGGGFSWP